MDWEKFIEDTGIHMDAPEFRSVDARTLGLSHWITELWRDEPSEITGQRSRSIIMYPSQEEIGKGLRPTLIDFLKAMRDDMDVWGQETVDLFGWDYGKILSTMED